MIVRLLPSVAYMAVALLQSATMLAVLSSLKVMV